MTSSYKPYTSVDAIRYGFIRKFHKIYRNVLKVSKLILKMKIQISETFDPENILIFTQHFVHNFFNFSIWFKTLQFSCYEVIFHWNSTQIFKQLFFGLILQLQNIWGPNFRNQVNKNNFKNCVYFKFELYCLYIKIVNKGLHKMM